MATALGTLRVLDLSRYAPGFYVSMYLGDMGADVIKIEEPTVTGRRAEYTERPLDYKVMDDARGAAFNSLERNKRKIALNLKDDDARHVFYKLVARSDVVLEGSRPGVAERLGVNYTTCAKINPRIVYCSLTGFGQDGPYRLQAGHDINYISIGGALGTIGHYDGRPTIPSNLIADYAGGAQNAIIGILTALLARGQTGRGQFVDIAMTDGVVGLQAQAVQSYFSSGEVPRPAVTRLNGGEPHYHVYETSDGRWIAIGANEPWFFHNLCRLLGHPEIASLQADPDNRHELETFLKDSFKTNSADYWHSLLSTEDTCATKIFNYDEVFSDAQILQREMVLELDHPVVGKVRQIGIAVKLSDTPGSIQRFAGTKGEHSTEILEELGYTTEEIRTLQQKGATL